MQVIYSDSDSTTSIGIIQRGLHRGYQYTSERWHGNGLHGSGKRFNHVNIMFHSVYTHESYPIPSTGQSPYPDIPPLIIAVNGVIKQLQNLNLNKVSGPDDIHVFILKETAEFTAHVVTSLFQQSFVSTIIQLSSII